MLNIEFKLNNNLYLKDPHDTELGEKIISASIKMIDLLGFERFTFKKLAQEINSTEASIYRYFDNKHRLLTYLVTWYWRWMEYRIDYQTHFIKDPYERLSRTIEIVTEKVEHDSSFDYVDEPTLHRIVIAESDKTYLNKKVDENNKEGLYRGYKSLCHRIATFIQELNPEYPYPHSLISTVLEAAHQQIFFSQHLPSLSDIKISEDDFRVQLQSFLKGMVFNTIQVGENQLKPVSN